MVRPRTLVACDRSLYGSEDLAAEPLSRLGLKVTIGWRAAALLREERG